MNRERISAVPGGEHDGYVQWYVNWDYTYESTNQDCRVATVSMELSTEVTLPRWAAPSDAPPLLVEQWSTYMDALIEHEDGHVEFGREAEAAIRNAIFEIPAAPSCSQLEDQIDLRATQTLERYLQLERDKTGSPITEPPRGAGFHSAPSALSSSMITATVADTGAIYRTFRSHGGA